MSDDIFIDTILEAQAIIARHIAGEHASGEETIAKLMQLLDSTELVKALAKRGFSSTAFEWDAHEAGADIVSGPLFRSSPRKRGPSPWPWIPAFAGMNGVCVSVKTGTLPNSAERRRFVPVRRRARFIRPRAAGTCARTRDTSFE